jgi:RNA-directed DNA polymerase
MVLDGCERLDGPNVDSTGKRCERRKWFNLIDKVTSLANLGAAFTKVARNDGAAGVDHVTIDMFAKRLDHQLDCLSEALATGTYHPQAVRRTWIPKLGSNELRPLGIPTVRDRIVQGALRHVLEPIFERDFAEHSYGFRPGRGCIHALRRVEQLLEAGYTHVVDADLKGYFDTIDHEILMQRIEGKVADGKVLDLLRGMLRQGIMEDLKHWTPETGSPQGSVISPLLSNIYLDPLDHLLQERGYEMVRYADDFVILCRSLSFAFRKGTTIAVIELPVQRLRDDRFCCEWQRVFTSTGFSQGTSMWAAWQRASVAG